MPILNRKPLVSFIKVYLKASKSQKKLTCKRFIVYQLLMVLFILFVLFIIRRCSRTNSSLNNSSISKNNNQTFNYNKNIQELTTSRILDIQNIYFYVPLLEMHDKLYLINDLDFMLILKEFVKINKQQYLKSIQESGLFTILFYNIIRNKEENKFKTNKTVKESYYIILYIFSNLLKTISNSIDDHKEDIVEDYSIDLFIYQQFFLADLLNIILITIEVYENIIIKIINELIKHAKIIEILEKLKMAFIEIIYTLFSIIDSDLDFEYNGEKIHIEYLMASFNTLQIFVNFNFYILYLHIFLINSDFEVVAIRKEYADRYLKHNEFKSNNKNDLFLASLINVCRNSFSSVMKYDLNSEIQMTEFLESNHTECNEKIYELLESPYSIASDE